MNELSPGAEKVRASVERAARNTLDNFYHLPPAGVEAAWADFDQRFPWNSVVLPELPAGPALGRKAAQDWAQAAGNLMADSVTEIVAAMIALEAELWHARHPPGRPALRIVDGGAGSGSAA